MVNKQSVLIWQRLLVEHTSRKLDYTSIVHTAMKIADRGGLAAVSMRNVAAALHVGTMSLYRYVSGKDDLLDLILDAAYSEIPLPKNPGPDWRTQLTRVAIDSRRALKSHAWLGSLVTQRPTLGPNYLRWFEFLLAATTSPNRNMRTQVRMIGTLWSYITGFLAYELGETETNRRHNLTEAKKRLLARPYLSQIISTGRHPYLQQFLKSRVGEPTDTDFRAGLRAVLAGIAFL